MTDIRAAFRDRNLFGRFFGRTAWNAWETCLATIFGGALRRSEIALYHACTGRTAPPTAAAREAWLAVGRRGGKSRIAAFVALFLACFRDYSDVLAPGEVGTVAVIAADRRQARTIMRYITGFLDHIPLLGRMVTKRTAEAIEFENRTAIEVHTASFRAIRGYTIVAAVLDELAFWWTDETSANPDVEIINGLRPGMATVPGALLLAISSPYARRGALFDAHRRHFGKDGDPVLVWQAPTHVMNPTINRDVIAAAYEQDAAAARAEFGAEFRADIEAFLTGELVDAVTIAGRDVVTPDDAHDYVAFVDPAGGTGGDSMTLAIGHIETRAADGSTPPAHADDPFGDRPDDDDERDIVVVDRLVERRPPFNPADVVRDFARVLSDYRVFEVVGDRYAGAWPAERFAEQGITYAPSPDTKSGLYLAMLPAIAARDVELPDHGRLKKQLTALERRTSRTGRDIVDHGPRGHDDLANAVAGLVVVARAEAHVGGDYDIEEAYGV